MKYCTLILCVVSSHVFAQQEKDSLYIDRKELIGVWQQDTRRVGDGLAQHFQFFTNGNFVVNLGNESDDARTLIALKGRYRLIKNKLYITISSRRVVEGGQFVIDDPGVSSSIFSIVDGEIKDIPERNLIEISDPIIITIIRKGTIKLGGELYYKISKEALDRINFKPGK